MSFNLAVMLSESALAHPAKPVCVGASRLTFGELDAASDRVAAALLHSGLHRGDRVVLQLPNNFQFLYAYFGILKAGLVAVPVNPQLKDAEIAHIMADSGATYHICDVEDPVFGGSERVGIVATSADDTAVIIYTSGTTGKPKGAALSHFQLYLSTTVSGETFGVEPDDVTIATLPFFHVYGLSSIVNASVRFGVTIALIERFQADHVLDVMAAQGVSVFLGVPTMYHALLHAEVGDRDLSRFRLASCGGSAMPEAVLQGFEEKFGVVILEGFGMSETGSAGMLNRRNDRRLLSIGKPLWGVAARVCDSSGVDVAVGEVGELLLSGHIVMKGYHGNPSATAEAVRDGWLHTGDLVRQDEDGFFFVVDRLKDLIIRGGYNVYPREIEEVLYGHPAVAEAAVIGRPDERLGEEIVAVVSPKSGHSIDAAELIAYCRSHLAVYKCPREIRVMPALPKSDTGKLLKRALR